MANYPWEVLDRPDFQAAMAKAGVDRQFIVDVWFENGPEQRLFVSELRPRSALGRGADLGKTSAQNVIKLGERQRDLPLACGNGDHNRHEEATMVATQPTRLTLALSLVWCGVRDGDHVARQRHRYWRRPDHPGSD